jgi:diguanylate cyclase (GGDEF)-like protein
MGHVGGSSGWLGPAAGGDTVPDGRMSFRNRLTLFFVLIVVVPMVAVAFVLFRLIADNESGKSDAQLAASSSTAIALRDEAIAAADRGAVAVGRDTALAQALRSGDRAALTARASVLLKENGAQRVVLSRGGRPLVDVGSRTAIFPATRRLTDRGDQPVAQLQVSVQEAGDYAGRIKRVTKLDAVVQQVGGPLMAATIRGVDPAELPASRGELKLGGRTYESASFVDDGFLGARDKVSILSSKAVQSRDVRHGRLWAGGILAGFFVLAFTFALIVSRSLQRLIDALLQAARRLQEGEFGAEVATVGRDEFAALGQEFNKMSRQLAERVEELNRERARLQEAMRRIGETAAANLDREGLLEIVVRTAIDGLGAEAGRASVRPSVSAPLQQVVSAGRVEGLEQAIAAAEAKVLETGEPCEATLDGAAALSHPLHRGDDAHALVSGVVSVARRDRRFTEDEREFFHYLAAQAAVSIENVGLHETVERQAITDDLTGLSNRRRFQDALVTEVERSRRFAQPVGLVLLDLDDFKQVNDTHGHQQGDLVLREVARVLRETSREIDEPARYGGEELAVVLPGTDLEGAYNLAERVRIGIEELELPLLDGDGTLQVTASFGVATLPGSAEDMRGLVSAADDALYRAKRAGKNRTVRAEGSPQR